jgi:hypothetical protein
MRPLTISHLAADKKFLVLLVAREIFLTSNRENIRLRGADVALRDCARRYVAANVCRKDQARSAARRLR